ncbi:MAG TPA: ATP-binding protein [Candidatus Obscuribacterales bacterium]
MHTDDELETQVHATRERIEHSIKAEETLWDVPSAEPLLISRAKSLSRLLGLTVTVFSIIAIIGCLFGIDELRNPTPWGTYIKFNAASCMLLVGTGTLIAHTTWRLRSTLVLACAAVVAVIAGLSLCEWIFGFNAGIDQLIVHENVIRHTFAPGRLPGSAALAFAILGLSLAALTFCQARLSQIAAFTSVCIGLITLTGHTYGFGDLLSFGKDTLIAFPMSIALTLAGVAVLLVVPESGIAQVCVSKSLGGKLLRRLLPIVLLVPAIGLITGVGRTTPMEMMILAITTTALFPGMVWLTARTVDRLDRQKDLALAHAVRRKEELELLNRELEEARDEALAASNLKSAFVANISHELRTPLSGIIGNLELLLESQAAEADRLSSLHITMACAQSLLHIVNDLLDLSKIESGKFSLDSSTFCLASVAHDVAKAVADAAQRKGLLLSVDIDPQLPTTVEGDKDRIQQVLLNLVNNAIKFTCAGAVQVRILLDSCNGDDVCRVRFEVADTGIGISQEDQQLLFKPFSQVDSSATRKYGGAGLGLSLSKNLVNLMGGDIGVHSAPGTGSTFWFVLPLAQSKKLDFSPPKPEPVQPLPAGSNKLVLVVEDNLVVQTIVLKQLTSIGVQPMAASCGREALQLVENVHFDLILMDCNLPDLSGLDVTRQIRTMEIAGDARTPIVAMTAAAMEGDRDSCLSAGMNDYLSKPVTMKQLSDVVHKWTDQHPGAGPIQPLHVRL